MAAHGAEQHLSNIVAAAAGVHASKKVLEGLTAATILAEAERYEADLVVVGASARSTRWQRRGTVCEVSSQARCAVLTVPVDVPADFAGRILLPVDFSIATEMALEWALLLARSFGSHVDVLHALPEQTGPAASSTKRVRLTAALTRLAAIVACLREAGVSDITSVLVEGDTLDAILARKQSESSGLIIMGNHVTPPVRDPDGGSRTIARVRASLAVPVLSVRGPPIGSEWNWQEVPRRGCLGGRAQAVENLAAYSC